VALISQSGASWVDHMIKFAGEGVGLSIGDRHRNKALIREIDLLRYFAADPETEVIAFYIEGSAKTRAGSLFSRPAVFEACYCPESGKALAGGMQAISQSHRLHGRQL